MDALILAAGYGMRMDNLTKDIPKPLLKIKNKTLISYAIDLIKNMSFDKIYINTHYTVSYTHLTLPTTSFV